MPGLPNRHPYPYKLQQLDADTNKRISAAFHGFPNGLQSANPWGFKLAATATEADLEDFFNYPLDPRDIWLVSPPRTGTTWTSEMIWLLANDLDYEGAKSPLLPDRWNYLDWGLVGDKEWMQNFIRDVEVDRPEASKELHQLQSDPLRPSPKFVRTHLPLSMHNPRVLETCKTFFLMRRPKDACLSLYKYCCLSKKHDFVLDLPAFAQMYMDAEAPWTPSIPMMIEGWNRRHHPSLCLLFYEDLIQNLTGQLKRMASFLGKSYTDQQIDQLSSYLHIDNFRKNPAVNCESGLTGLMMNKGGDSFIRRGKVGDWLNHCTPELDAKFEAWIEKQLKGSDLKFATEV